MMEEKLHSLFLGPKGENIDTLRKLLDKVLNNQQQWRGDAFTKDPSLYSGREFDLADIEAILDEFLTRSNKSIPYFHPRYIAQMLKDPAIPTILGYLTFMLSNPNNHAYEGGPVTTEMEMEVTDMLLALVGYKTGWGHLASGGSLANLEALYAARDYYKEGSVFFSSVSHYSWKRICNILRIESFRELPVDSSFRLDLNALEGALKKEKALIVMANLGSTGTGSIDNIEEILKLRDKYGFHLHIDAAYGGFAKTALLNNNNSILPYSEELPMSEYTYRQLLALQHSDSVTIDPHKLGLTSYGAGAVLYKNEKLRDIILNTAPYTYHKKDKPNIGMFSLEGSRPGAMAAACWLTYKMLPLNRAGVGAVIDASFRASQELYKRIESSDKYRNLHQPDLDINCFYPSTEDSSVQAINKAAIEVYNKLSIESENPPFILSKFVIPPKTAAAVLPESRNEANDNLTTLRAVMMKHWAAENNFYYIKELMEVLNTY